MTQSKHISELSYHYQESYSTLAPIIIGKLPAETWKTWHGTEWTVDDLKAAVLKKSELLRLDYIATADQPANVQNSFRAPMAMYTASIYTGIKGTQPTTPTNSD